MKCTKCGREGLPEGTSVCPVCGKGLASAQTETSAKFSWKTIAGWVIFPYVMAPLYAHKHREEIFRKRNFSYILRFGIGSLWALVLLISAFSEHPASDSGNIASKTSVPAPPAAIKTTAPVNALAAAEKPAQANVQTAEAAIEAKEKPEEKLPNTEAALIAVVRNAVEEYDSAPNELKKSAARGARAKAIKAALGGTLKIKDWIGKLSDLQTTSEGKAFITIKLMNSDVTIKTWNNAFSDLSDNTLIPQSSALFKALSEMKKKELVKFSGSFIRSDRDFISEGSMTESGSMNSPEFIFRFSEVKPF